jgi:hypothetical protein
MIVILILLGNRCSSFRKPKRDCLIERPVDTKRSRMKKLISPHPAVVCLVQPGELVFTVRDCGFGTVGR